MGVASMTVICLRAAAGLASFLSAIFWGFSAWASAPPTTWEKIGELPAFLNRVSRYNFVAALFAALATFLAGIAETIGAADV
jgi:hypothetical protein